MFRRGGLRFSLIQVMKGHQIGDIQSLVAGEVTSRVLKREQKAVASRSAY